jgi:hypothetical protein
MHRKLPTLMQQIGVWAAAILIFTAPALTKALGDHLFGK